MINLGQILGRVGKIETKALASGVQVTNISMVTSKKYMKDNMKQEKSTWHNITLYSKLSEIAEKYVQIGDLLYISGEMDNQKYTGKDGIERNRAFIIGHELKLMPKGKEYKKEEKKEPAKTNDFIDDDIPF